MNRKKQQAIKSAESVAALRAAAYKEKDKNLRCSDDLASCFLNTPYRLLTSIRPHRLLKKILHKMSPGSYHFAITRTKHFDEILKKEALNGIEQLVILGAGYDTRAIRFQDLLKSVDVYEVDFYATQENKRKILHKKVKDIPENIHFIPVDFNKDSFEAALEFHGFETDKKTLFLWEGVSYYLPEAVVRHILCFVSSCKNGSSIVFDYALEKFVKGDYSTFGGEEIAKWLKKIQEPFLFGLEPTQTTTFLTECNLTLCSDLSPEELEQKYLKTQSGEIAGKTLGHVHMAHAIV
ncbi:class I SAM-dependent methyltransferase [Aquimarina hainanensis]|uniref:S-adenosyl-L-methionine-dependent methyltransferase n=2 Tax=Aquimarina hainanensis TaxID=1578017 RepID=A0ABW5NF03_9FLAO